MNVPRGLGKRRRFRGRRHPGVTHERGAELPFQMGKCRIQNVNRAGDQGCDWNAVAIEYPVVSLCGDTLSRGNDAGQVQGICRGNA